MSTPRALDSVKELLSACREHELDVRGPDGHGHWQVWTRRGDGKQTRVAVVPSTPHGGFRFMNVVATIRRETGIDLRFPPVRLMAVPSPEPVVPPAPVGLDTPSGGEIRRIVREELRYFFSALAPPPEVKTVEKIVEKVIEVPVPAETTKAGVPRKKRRANLTPQERTEIVDLVEAGERHADVARTYNLAPSAIGKILETERLRRQLAAATRRQP